MLYMRDIFLVSGPLSVSQTHLPVTNELKTTVQTRGNFTNEYEISSQSMPVLCQSRASRVMSIKDLYTPFMHFRK